MNKSIVNQQAKTSSLLTPAQGILQRKCACGNHKTAKGECGECGKNNQGLQRTLIDSASLSFTGSHHGYRISRMPAHHNGPGGIQSKFTISQPGDKYEQEADRVAASVMSSQPNNDGPKALATNSSSNRSKACSNLDGDTKSFMEARFATNFDQVRIHTGSQASKATVALGAKAFAMGPDIYFSNGEYQPHTSSGRLLLAHELTHVVQQGHAEPMLQRKEMSASSDLTKQTSTTASSNSIGSVVDEAYRSTQRAIKSLERALNEANAALAEKRFDGEKLARIRVQANKLRPMLEAYRKVERGEQPDSGLTLDFDPKRDQIDDGDADLLASRELEDSGTTTTASPQAYASHTERSLVSLRVNGVHVQRVVCGGLCIGGAIALGALLLSGCSEKKPKSKKKAGVDSFKVKWTKHSGAGGANAKLRLDYNAKFKKDALHDPALAEFRQNVMTTWDITAGPHKGTKGTTAPMHDDNYSRADDLSGNKITDVDFYSNDNPGIVTVHADDVIDYSFTAEQMIIDTSQSNKVIAKRGPHTGTVKGKHPRTYTGVPTTLS